MGYLKHVQRRPLGNGVDRCTLSKASKTIRNKGGEL
jgi:hypothetical protein